MGGRPEMSCRGITFDVSAKDFEFEREMGEHMRDCPGAPPVAGKGRCRLCGRSVHPSCPGGGRHFRHAAEQPFLRPLAQKNGTVVTHGNESSAAPQRLFGLW